MELKQDYPTAGPWPAPASAPPGSGAPVGGMFPPPPVPIGPGSRRWIAWGALFGVVALLAAVIVVPKLVRGVTAPIGAANTYLGLLRDGQTDAAYRLLCSEAQQAMTPAEFAAQLAAETDQQGQLQSFDVYASMVEIGGDASFVDYRVRTSKTGSFERQARLFREGGQWKWCGSRPGSG